jgi:hypothetical protein
MMSPARRLGHGARLYQRGNAVSFSSMLSSDPGVSANPLIDLTDVLRLRIQPIFRQQNRAACSDVFGFACQPNLDSAKPLGVP